MMKSISNHVFYNKRKRVKLKELVFIIGLKLLGKSEERIWIQNFGVIKYLQLLKIISKSRRFWQIFNMKILRDQHFKNYGVEHFSTFFDYLLI